MGYFTANLTPEEQDVRDELARQDAKWGEQNHPDGTNQNRYSATARDWQLITEKAAVSGLLTWRHIFLEEVYEALAEVDPKALLDELLQVEAVARQWRLSIRRRLANAPSEEA